MKELQFNQKEFANRCGFSPALFQYWKKGVEPSFSTIQKICFYTGYPVSYFIPPDTLPENTLGEIIKKYRVLSGLSHEQLAVKVKLSINTIKDYEYNRLKGNSKVIDKIFEAIGYNKEIKI